MLIAIAKPFSYHYSSIWMGNFREKTSEVISSLRQSKALSLAVILILAAAIPLTVYISQKQQDIRQRAATTQSKEKQKPEYATGEVIVRFRPQLLSSGRQAFQFDIKKGTGVQTQDLDKKPIPFSALDEKSVPPVLTDLDQKYKIKTIDKIFKGAGTPQEEVSKFKQKFSAQIAEGKVKVDEKRLSQLDFSRTYRLSFEVKVPIESVLGDLIQSRDVLYAEPNYIYKTQQEASSSAPAGGGPTPIPTSSISPTPCPTSASQRLGVSGSGGDCPILSPIPTPTPLPSYPNDPYFWSSNSWGQGYEDQWNLKKIKMSEAWEIASSAAEVKVAVIDTGVDYTHPEFGGCTLQQVNNNQCPKILPGFDFVNDDYDPNDDFGHGTHVAGIIAATTNNAIGISGIANNAKIIPIKALNSDGYGTLSALALGIYDAVGRGAQIINASWGGIGQSHMLTEAISYAYAHNVIFVAAAGNNDDNVNKFFPANITCSTSDNPDIDCTMTVASTDQYDQKSDFSNWGTGIDVAAPGGRNTNILSLKSSTITSWWSPYIVGENYLRLQGTSMAAPHVAALAALVLGKNSALTNDQVRNAIINGVDDLGTPSFDILFGYGRINAFKALSEVNTNIPSIARISYPQQDFIIGKKFKIIGSSYATNFSNYTIDYATSQNATSWSNNGITLNNSGSSSVHNGLLATADFNDLGDGTYYIRLATNTSDGKSAFTMISIRLDKSTRDNFPIFTGASIFDEQPIIADLNGDGKKETIFKNAEEGRIYAIEPDGTNLSGWPVSTDELYSSYYVSNGPIVADLDSSYSGLEVIQPVSHDGWGEQLLAFHADGTPVSGWTVSAWQAKGSLGYPNDTISSGIIGGKTVIVYAEGWRFHWDTPPMIHVFDQTGNDLPGWPVSAEANGAIRHTAIVADIDKDDNPEIIVDYFNKIRIYGSNGILKKEITVSNNPSRDAFQGDVLRNIVVGDINGNGLLNIIATTVNYASAPSVASGGGGGSNYTSTQKVYVWDNLGNIRQGSWPFTLSTIQSYPCCTSSLLNIGNFDNTNAEILTYFNNNYYLLDKNASLVRGFPNSGSTSNYAIQNFAANVTLSTGNHLLATGDYQYYLSGTYLYEYNPSSGSLTTVSGYPKSFNLWNYPLVGNTGQPGLLDLDNDGKLELTAPVQLFSYGLSSDSRGYLYVFNLDYAASFLDWPQYLHDEKHTGAYLPPTSPTPTPLPPAITSIGPTWKQGVGPAWASQGDKVTIKGSGFSPVASQNHVYVGGVLMPEQFNTVSSDGTQLIFVLTTETNFEIGNYYDVYVTNKYGKSNSVKMRIISPTVLFSAIPNPAPRGEGIIILRGINFGQKQGSVFLYDVSGGAGLGAVTLGGGGGGVEIKSWKNNEIRIILPKALRLAQQSKEYTVWVNGSYGGQFIYSSNRIKLRIK